MNLALKSSRHGLASFTGAGHVCVIATAAYGSPLADEINVFRAVRDRVLLPTSTGRSFVDYYYRRGPVAAAWLGNHEGAKVATRMVLSAVAMPLKPMMFGAWWFWLSTAGACALLLTVGAALLPPKYRGLRHRLALTFALAFSLVIGYSLLMDTPEALIGRSTTSRIRCSSPTLKSAGK